MRAKGNVEGLIEALKHKDSGIRKAATAALEEIVGHLIEVLEDTSIAESPLRLSPREVAALKLGKIGDRRAIRPLLGVFTSESESGTLRTLALEVLGKIGGDETRQGLMDAFESKGYKIRRAILHALENGKLEKVGLSRNILEEKLSPMDRAERYCEEGVTCWNAKQWEAALAKWREATRLNPNHPLIHSRLGQVHVELGDIQEAQREFRKQIKVNPDEFYSHAMLSIIYRALDNLIGAISEEQQARATSEYRINRVFIPPDYARKVQDMAIDKRREINSLIASAQYTKDPKIAVRLTESLRDEDWEVQEAVAEALGKMGEPAVEALTEALKDEGFFVRAEAAVALGKIGDARAVEPLIQALKNEDSFVRSAAEIALKKIRGY
jgi:HEAT repeat protein